jgi:uncharacterized membrane protein (UPF0136 family)
MKNRYYANISHGNRPIFPKCCVICGVACREEQEIIGNPKVAFLGGFQWLLGGSIRQKIYGHKACVKKLNRQLVLRSLSLFIALSFFIPIEAYGLNPFIFIPITLLVAAAILTYQLRNPVPFEITEIGDMLSIEFQHKEIADQFAKLNNVQLY